MNERIVPDSAPDNPDKIFTRAVQVRPQMVENCTPWTAQGCFSGGIMVCMGDGSTRYLRKNIADATWAALNDPRDGGVVSGE